jgi:hypothetical protein
MGEIRKKEIEKENGKQKKLKEVIDSIEKSVK